MELVNSVEQERKVQRKRRCDIIKKKNDVSRFVKEDLTNIYKKTEQTQMRKTLLKKKKKKVSREFSCKCLSPKRKFVCF